MGVSNRFHVVGLIAALLAPFCAWNEVTVIVNPLRTEEKIGKFVRVTLPDGTELSERAIRGQ